MMSSTFSKILFVCGMFFSTLIFFTDTTFAANPKTAFVIVSEPFFRSKDYVNYATGIFREKKLSIENGNNVQRKYMQYWIDKGLLREGKATTKDFINFVSYGGYKKVIYLVPNISSFTFVEEDADSSSAISFNIFLADKEKILKVYISDTEYESFTHLFKKLLRNALNDLSPFLK